MIEIKVLRKKRIRTIRRIMLTAFALILLTTVAIVGLSYFGETLKIEAGEDVDLCDIFNNNDVEFDSDFNKDNLNHPGTYECNVLIGNRTKKIKIIVTDTQAPEIEVFDKIYVSSTENLPTPEQLVKKGYDPDGYTGKFLTNMDYDFQMGKTYMLSVRYSDPSGNKTQVFDIKVTFIADTEAPKIIAPEDITFATDEAISYKSIVKVSDNCIGDVTL